MLGVDHFARHGRDLLETWKEHSAAADFAYLFICIFLVLFAG